MIGNQVYHFQYNFNDKILYLIRDPWEEFRFHYSVWENRSIHLSELGIPEEAKEEYKTNWDSVYLTQRKWIENLNELKADEAWISFLNSSPSNEKLVYPVSGLGYFSNEDQSENSVFDLELQEREKITIDLDQLHRSSLDLSQLHESNNQALKNNFELSMVQSSFTPPTRYHSLSKQWENLERKKFFREFLISPKSFDQDSFISLSGSSEFLIEDPVRIHLVKLAAELEIGIHSCMSEFNKCTGIEEIVLLIRLYSIRESLKRGYFVIPKKANYDPFYFETSEEIPEEVLAEKQLEAVRLFQVAKMQFLEGGGELAFREWEKEIAKVDSLQRQKFDIISFETYPSKKGNRTFLRTEEIKNLGQEALTLISSQKTDYEAYVQKIYPYHIILQNCTSEIFRYHNQFYPNENTQHSILGGSISEKTSSLSFIPFIAATKVRSNYHVLSEKKILSYRLLKKNEANLSFLKNLKEDIVPFSSFYRKNPYDQDFLFFTDDTMLFRPVFGLSNVIWGTGASALGLFTIPWDKGKKVTNGVRSVFFSFPELVFMNIRKGYFPYITQKDLPRSYYQKVYE